MLHIGKQSPMSDDEDDLELLRMAALNSLKKPNTTSNVITNSIQSAPKPCNPMKQPFGSNKGLNKRGRGFQGGGRGGRNGPFNNRMRNSNLIAVPTIESESHKNLTLDPNIGKKRNADSTTAKLILPQDRYCNTNLSIEDKPSEVSSKFDRYNDSDNSDSESESDNENILKSSPKDFKRSSSLEALMAELEREINPSTECVQKLKCKTKKLKKPKSDPLNMDEVPIETNNHKNDVKTVNIKRSENVMGTTESLSSKKELWENRHSKHPVLQTQIVPTIDNSISQNNLVNRGVANLPYLNTNMPVIGPFLTFQPLPYTDYSLPLSHSVQFDAPLPYGNFQNTLPTVCSSDANGASQMFPSNRYERSISPLTINSDILNTITAPLSPRSAAFVLQNREIIERRKKSPRRSYSRSPSPNYRHSLSPRYRRSNSRSPLNKKRVLSRRASPTNRRSLPDSHKHSPNNLSPPRPASPYIINKHISSPTSNDVKPFKSSRKSPEPNNLWNRPAPEIQESSKNKEKGVAKKLVNVSPNSKRKEPDCGLDPVLEARRRKFESKQAVATAGVIRLKQKTNTEAEIAKISAGAEQISKVQSTANSDDEFKEEELLGGDDTYIECNIKVNDLLFSDDESDNENEGRFKSGHQQSPRIVPIMPFTQLLNGSSNTTKTEALLKEKRSHDRDKNRRDKSKQDKNGRKRADKGKNVEMRAKSTSEKYRNKETRDCDKNKEKATAADRQRSKSPKNLGSTTKNDSNNKTEETNKSGVAAMSLKKKEQPALKGLMSLKIDKPNRKKLFVTSPIENKKIEIKIRNPSKYEMENKADDGKGKKIGCSRKVEVAAKDNETEKAAACDADVIFDSDEEDDKKDVISRSDGAGDLRAQLSRKRAERQNKLPSVEGIQSRLLQNALQGAVFKKSKKLKKKDKDAALLDIVDTSIYATVKRTTTKIGYDAADSNCHAGCIERKVQVLHFDTVSLSRLSDGKLPIHLRLGIPGTMDAFSDSSSTKKTSRKRSKNRGSYDQV